MYQFQLRHWEGGAHGTTKCRNRRSCISCYVKNFTQSDIRHSNALLRCVFLSVVARDPAQSKSPQRLRQCLCRGWRCLWKSCRRLLLGNHQGLLQSSPMRLPKGAVSRCWTPHGTQRTQCHPSRTSPLNFQGPCAWAFSGFRESFTQYQKNKGEKVTIPKDKILGHTRIRCT